MTTASGVTRVKTALWFATFLGAALVACGNLTSTPQDPPDTSPGGDSSTVQAGTTQRGGSTSGAGGTSGGITLVMTTAGTTNSNVPLHSGTAGEGGQPDYPAVSLCIYPEDIPESWGAGGGGGGGGDGSDGSDGSDGAEASGSGRDCVIGVLGEFSYMDCRYDLLRPEAFNVDPFVGGHSHCCYAARLIACK
jgi:hypothetical protein